MNVAVSDVYSKSEKKNFKKKYRPADILLNISVMIYFKFLIAIKIYKQ